MAWQFLCHLNQRETIEFLLEKLPLPRRGSANVTQAERMDLGLEGPGSHETTPLMSGVRTTSSRWRLGRNQSPQGGIGSQSINNEGHERSQYSRFAGLNALEIAAIAQAKRFLSQHVVQRVVNDIWTGEIVFWDSLTVHSTKKPHIFNRK